jgi:hypothetical protein
MWAMRASKGDAFVGEKERYTTPRFVGYGKVIDCALQGHVICIQVYSTLGYHCGRFEAPARRH